MSIEIFDKKKFNRYAYRYDDQAHDTHWDCIQKVQNSKYRIQIKNIVNNIIDCNYNLMFFKKHK
jgi:hypothetical protein